ncbi:MAG: GDSL-type esterase/lipase family protein [Oscillospiraceae bacterium]
MAKKAQIMCYVTIIVVALSLSAALFVITPTCSNCGSKLCFGRCTIVYDIDNPTNARLNAPKTNQNTTRLFETERADSSYLNNITFVGDSRTVGLVLYEIPEENIFAEDGLNHEQALTKEVVRLNENKLTTIKDAVLVTAPDIMMVNFGINGAAYMPVDSFMEGYAKLIDELLEASPSSIVVIESIMPVSLSYEQTETGCSNEKIDEINDALYEMAKEKGLYYLATNEVMKNENNDLINTYHRGDGIHYNAKAYDAIIEYILTHEIYRK